MAAHFAGSLHPRSAPDSLELRRRGEIQSIFAVTLNSIERAVAAPLVGLAADRSARCRQQDAIYGGIDPSGLRVVVCARRVVPARRASPARPRTAPVPIRKLYLKGARYMNIATAFICGLLALMPSPIPYVGRQAYRRGRISDDHLLDFLQVNLMTGPGTSILKGIGLPNEEFYYCLPNVLALLIALPAARFIQGQWTALGIA